MELSKPIFTIITITLFVAAATLGIQMTMADNHGNMTPCPLMNGLSSICPMNIIQHMAAWQLLFSATMPTTIVLLLALMLLLVGFSSINSKEDFSATAEFSNIKRRNSTPLFFNPLRLAFSKGILHTKIYFFSR
jgi:hypothetical protein